METTALLRIDLDRDPKVYPLKISGLEAQVWPRLYVCPACCRVWAQLSLLGRWDYVQILTPCHACLDINSAGRSWELAVPGSLLNQSSMIEPTADGVLLRALPEALLRRELELHIRALERKNDSRFSNALSANSALTSEDFNRILSSLSESGFCKPGFAEPKSSGPEASSGAAGTGTVVTPGR